MKKLLFLFMLSVLMIGMAWGQTTVFTDDISTEQSATWTTSGQIGASDFTVNRLGVDWGARRNTNGILELTNDASGATNLAGWVFSYAATTGFSAPYNTTLSSNPGLVTWYVNMRQPRPDPAGFGSGNYGAAFVLAGSSTTAYNAGTGYAIALGQSGGTDPLRLVKYSAGITTLTNIIVSNTAGLTDFGTEYLSIKVTYNPADNQWELFLRNDGASAFADPQTGSLTSQGTATDNAYTSTALDYMGAYWQGSFAANLTASFDNISVMVTGTIPEGDPLITVTGTPLESFGGVLVGQASLSQQYTVECSDLEDAIEITASAGFELSLDDENWEQELVLDQTDGVVSETIIYVRFVPSAVQVYNGNVQNASPSATTVNVSVVGTGIKAEPSNHASSFAAAAGTNPETEILVTWIDAVGDVLPDGYLIKVSNIGYSSIEDPQDGVVEINGTYIRNVGTAVQSWNFTNFASSTTHYFKIFSYSNSGSSINYKKDDFVPQTSFATTIGPALVDIIVPQYIQGLNGTNNQRLPWASRLRLENLSANSTYRYFGMFVEAVDIPTANGAGIGIFASPDAIFSRSTSLSLATLGQYSEFTTNASGVYEGWFMGEPSANARFTPGKELWYRLMLNNGSGGTTVALRLTTSNSFKVINFGTQNNVNQGTFLYGVSQAPPKNFVFVYDNEEGTGRPISGSVIESDDLDLSGVTQILPSYKTNVDAVAGAWGLIIPNSTGSKDFAGIKRIESRDFVSGDIDAEATDSDGVWPSGANTVNPLGGDSTPIVMGAQDATLPVELSGFYATYSAENMVKILWITQSESNSQGYYIFRGMNTEIDQASMISPMIESVNSSTQQSYSYTDNEIFAEGTYYYWLQSVDMDGSFSFHGPISVMVSFDQGGTGIPELPIKTALSSIFPNPFNPSTFIRYSLSQDANVKISIYNSRGQFVRQLLDTTKGIGYHRVEWNGKDSAGNTCGTGIYYIRMQAGNDSFVRKAMMMK